MDRLLIIDDDAELCGLLKDYLAPEGFVVEAEHDGTKGAERALSGSYSLVVLDVMLPGTNGFEVLKKIRATSRLPVLMLTARGDEVDRIVGLEIGADDYLPKPFNPRELVARIRAVLRRTAHEGQPKEPTARIAIGQIELVPGTRTAYNKGRAMELTSVEFSILEALMRQAGHVMSREELTVQALGRQLSAYDRSIDVHVSSLRKKLGQSEGGTELIKTVRNAGYMFPVQP